MSEQTISFDKHELISEYDRSINGVYDQLSFYAASAIWFFVVAFLIFYASHFISAFSVSCSIAGIAVFLVLTLHIHKVNVLNKSLGEKGWVMFWEQERIKQKEARVRFRNLYYQYDGLEISNRLAFLKEKLGSFDQNSQSKTSSISLFAALSSVTCIIIFGMGKLDKGATEHGAAALLSVLFLALALYAWYEHQTRTGKKLSEMVYCYEVADSYRCNDATSQLAEKITRLEAEMALARKWFG